MTEDQPDPIFTQPVAPPTQPAIAVQPDRPSTWPKVIGIIAIVLASLDMLGGAAGLMAPFLQDFIKALVPKGQTTGLEMLDSLNARRGGLIVVALLTLGLGAWLLYIGIALLRRRRLAVRAGVAWAPLKMAFVVGNSVFQWGQFEAMSQQMSNIPNMPQMGSGFMAGIGVVSIVMGIAWGWALPVFFLIWFSRKRIKAEVADWR